MASGKKNYFRHSFFARNDIKLRLLRDEVGVGFYFYYFSLLELCGEECSEKSRIDFEFHNSIIRSLWGVNLKKSEHVASVMDAVGLLLFKKLEKSFYFEIPNFPKYLGHYTNKKETNTSNKRKEKKIKEKKIKVKKNDVLLVKECWNDNAVSSSIIRTTKIDFELAKKLNDSVYQVSDICIAIENYWKVVKDSNCLISHSWPLLEFLGHEKAWKYYPDQFNYKSFVKDGVVEEKPLYYPEINEANL